MHSTDPSALEDLANDMPPPGMNAKTALLAGIIVGVCLMVGLVGFLAWREKQVAEEAEKAVPSAVVPSAKAPARPSSGR